MGTISGPFSIPDGLIYHIDPANPKSYIGTGTTIYDLSGNGNTSYFTNGALYQNYQKGVVVVDGNNDYISTPIFNLTSPVTVSAWIKNVVNDSAVMGAAGPGIGYGNGEALLSFSGKSIYIQGANSGGKYYQFPQLNLNEWVHLTMTRDVGNNMRVYLNGIGSTSNPQSHSNTIQMNQIGRYSSFTNQYNAKGSIGEVKIYNRALSASEVLQNYNATKKRYVPEENYVTSNLVVNLDFGDTRCYPGTGNTAYDLTGLGHTASLINGAALNLLYGGNILCDGTNDYIEVQTTSALDFGANNFSVEYWYRKTEWTTLFENIWGPNIWSAGDNASTNEWSLGIGQGAVSTPGIGESVAFGLQIPSLGVYSTPQIRVTGNLNKFNQLVGIRNGSLIELYYNGYLMYSANPGGGFNNSMQLNNVNNILRISNSSINQYHSKAHTGILRIYNKALSAAEVNQNYRAMLPRFSDPALITDGLILNYDFGSAETYPGVGTNAQNLVGTGYTGALTNSPAYSTLAGGSLTFNGTNTYISSADPGLLVPFTMNVWVYFNSLSGWQTFIGQDTSTAVPRGRFYFQRANLNSVPDNIIAGRVNFSLIKSDGNVWVVNSQANPSLSTWTNYTVVVSSTQMSLYQNGILQESLSGTLSLQPGTGSITYGVGWYDSILADYSNLNMSSVQIYNRALSESEIAQNFNNMRNRFGI